MILLIRFSFVFLLYLSVPSLVQAQFSSLTFRQITRNTGLPVDEITALAQDSTGFIWIGTVEGIFRYDGYNFTNYSSINDSLHSLINAVSKIHVDKNNRIWIGTVDAGITCIESSGKLLMHISSRNKSIASAASDYVTDIKEDKEGNIWWTSVDGLFRVSPDATKLRCFKAPTKHPRGNFFSGLTIDRNGRMWITGNIGLTNFDIVKEQFLFTSVDHKLRNFFEHKKYISAIAFQADKLWYSTWAPDLGMYDLTNGNGYTYYSGVGSPHPDFDKLATVIYNDKRGAIWMATGDGLHFSHAGAASITATYQHNPENIFSIANDKVTAILEDRDGNFWFGTKSGISITQPYKQQVQNISVNSVRTFPFGSMEVSDIIEIDKNSLLIGTQNANGFYLTDSNFLVKKHFSFNTSDFDWAWTHWYDSLKQRFFISTQEGMLIYDKRRGTLGKAADTLLQNFHPVSAFVSTSDSILWMSSFWNRFLRYNLNTGEHKIFDLRQMGEKGQVLYLSKDAENRLWIIGHGSGLLRWNERDEKFDERLVADNTGQSLKQTEIYFFKDIGEYFVIGYYTRGISLYHKKKKTYEHFNTQAGLVSNLVRSAVTDQDGRVWIATKNGISHFNPATRTFKNYNADDGILHNDFVTITQLADGRIVAGGTKGIVSFHPDHAQEELKLNAPFITEIHVYGKPLQVDSFFKSKNPLRISYKKNYFSFEYISLLYSKTQQIEYAYLLEGVDKEWRHAGNRRFVSYSNVPGGKYMFRVKARLANGTWVVGNEAITILVSAPFYSTWWFYVGCALLIALLSYLIFKYRLAQILKLERMRTAISSDLHDEVGASLTSISLFSEIIRQPGSSPEKKEEYLERIGERSRESIEKMGDIIWSINPQNDNLLEMLVRMKNYATEVSELADITVHWTESSDLIHSHLSMEDRKNVYLFFKEAVNNAMKHSGAKNIRLSLITSGRKINLSIKDDGKGFDASGIKPGNGLRNLERRAALLNGTCTINSQKNIGTETSLQFASLKK